MSSSSYSNDQSFLSSSERTDTMPVIEVKNDNKAAATDIVEKIDMTKFSRYKDLESNKDSEREYRLPKIE